MSSNDRSEERRSGWISQLMRVRHRSVPDHLDATETEHTATADSETNRSPEQPQLELAQLCNYGESTDPTVLVDEQALEALCFQGDPGARPASAKKAVQRGESQRQSKRINVPAHFCHVGSGDYFQPIEANIILPPQFEQRILSCFLYDVNDGGAGFVAQTEIPAGTPVTLCLTHPDNATPLVAAETIVLHSKALEKGSMIPVDYIGDTLWLHGISLSKRDALIIYKATLDSMALNAAAGPQRHDN